MKFQPGCGPTTWAYRRVWLAYKLNLLLAQALGWLDDFLRDIPVILAAECAPRLASPVFGDAEEKQRQPASSTCARMRSSRRW